jgi:hypothetical protein
MSTPQQNPNPTKPEEKATESEVVGKSKQDPTTVPQDRDMPTTTVPQDDP